VSKKIKVFQAPFTWFRLQLSCLCKQGCLQEKHLNTRVCRDCKRSKREKSKRVKNESSGSHPGRGALSCDACVTSNKALLSAKVTKPHASEVYIKHYFEKGLDRWQKLYHL